MNDEVAKNLLINLGFSSEDVVKLNIFKDSLLKFNKDYNLISKLTIDWWISESSSPPGAF